MVGRKSLSYHTQIAIVKEKNKKKKIDIENQTRTKRFLCGFLSILPRIQPGPLCSKVRK